MTIQKTVIFFFLLLFTKISYAQVDFKSEVPNWLGEWEGSYTVDDWKNKEVVSIKWTHNKQWLEIDISGQSNYDPRMMYSETIMLTANNSGVIAGFSADDNGYDGMTMVSGKFSEKQLILNVNSSNWSGKIIWERKEGKLYKTVPSGKSTVQVIFTKKQ